MKNAAITLCSFILGINLFLTIVPFVPVDSLAQHYRAQIESEQIISKTDLQDSLKFLDSFFYNLASLVVPLGALFFWYFVLQKGKIPMWICWSVAVVWLLGAIAFVSFR